VRTFRGWYVASVMPPEITPYRGWLPCIDWCEQKFGPSGQDWLYNSEGVFEFKNDADRTMFALRWS
jgi:hypothetical protein